RRGRDAGDRPRHTGCRAARTAASAARAWRRSAGSTTGRRGPGSWDGAPSRQAFGERVEHLPPVTLEVALADRLVESDLNARRSGTEAGDLAVHLPAFDRRHETVVEQWFEGVVAAPAAERGHVIEAAVVVGEEVAVPAVAGHERAVGRLSV